MKVAEECAEVAHRISKLLRFGPDEVQPGQAFTNTERVADEVLDLVAALDLAGLRLHVMQADVDQRKARIERYVAYSVKQGTVHED